MENENIIITTMEEARIEIARLHELLDEMNALNKKLLQFQGDVTLFVSQHGSMSQADLGRIVALASLPTELKG